MALMPELDRPLHDAPRCGAALPLPDELAAYERGGAGRADWRIQTYETEAAHRRSLENMLTRGYVASSVAVAVGGSGWVLLRLFL